MLKDGWQKDAGALYVLMLGNIRKSIVASNKNTRVPKYYIMMYIVQVVIQQTCTEHNNVAALVYE